MKDFIPRPPELPKSIVSLPDVPEDGIWRTVERIAGILTKRFFDARSNPNRKITKKELMKQEANDMVSTSDNNIIARATPKQREDAFGMFLDRVLQDTRTQRDFSDAMDLLKETNPDKYVDKVLQIQKMRHPVDKNVDVNIDVEIKQTMHQRLKEQYRYSQQIEEAEVIEDVTQEEKNGQLAKMIAFQNPPEDEEEDTEQQ